MPEKWDTLVLRDALGPNLKVLQLLGYWPPEESSSLIRGVYQIYATFCVGFFFILYIVTEVINIVLSLDDLEKITEASFLFLTHFAQIIKLYHFTTKNPRICALANSLQGPKFRARNAKQYGMLKRSIFEAQFTFYLFISMSLSTCILWGIFPLIDQSADGHMALPLSSYYPFSTDNSPTFELIFAYQIISTSINAATNVSMDTTVSSFMSVICGELNVLNDSLVNIREFALERMGKRAVDLGLLDDSNHAKTHPELEMEMDKILIECVHQHWQILDATIEIGELFNIGVLSQFAVGTIIICITMFELTLVELFSLQFVSMVLYQGCMLVEIILYCWFGNEIILKSENICFSVYSSDWYRNSVEYKKKMLMIMTRTQVPIRLYAGNLFTLSLVTFAAILRSSWSYFAVLRRVHVDENEIQ
ncbi:odorant receptor Or1-like [Atheta coriaria]|uniref:odorant receptor Or1-like n=1 Tax=Dalotia coriaria TaxID=877792 RepID=UPI0031F3F586